MSNEDRKPLHVVKGEESKPVDQGEVGQGTTTPPAPRRRGNGWMLALGIAVAVASKNKKTRPKARR